MPKDKLDILEQKKHELETELERIQLELDDSIHKVRSDVSTTLNPIRYIKKYPWPIVGASLLLGFLVSGNGRKKSTSVKEDDSSKNNSSEKVFSPILFKELKRLAARRVASMATAYLEDVFQGRRSERSTSLSNGRKSVKKD